MDRLFFHLYDTVVLWNVMDGTSLLPLLWYRCFVERDGWNVSSFTYMLPLFCGT